LFRYTSKGKDVYSTTFHWPQNSQLKLGAVDSQMVSKIEMLGAPGELKFTMLDKGIQVQFPNLPPDTRLQYAWTLKITTK